MKSIEDQLTSHIEENQNTLDKLKVALEHFQKGEYCFVVSLISLWADHGEESVDWTGEPGESLESVMEKAQASFMDINDREDVQAKRRVFVEFPNGLRIMKFLDAPPSDPVYDSSGEKDDG